MASHQKEKESLALASVKIFFEVIRLPVAFKTSLDRESGCRESHKWKGRI